MYVPMSDEAKQAMRDKWTFRYDNVSEISSPTPSQETPTTISIVRKERPADRPIKLFTMRVSKHGSDQSSHLYNLTEAMSSDLSELMPARIFFLEMLIDDIIRELRADDYKFLFITSAIPHIVEVFLDFKFGIKARVRRDKSISYMGYKKIQ